MTDRPGPPQGTREDLLADAAVAGLPMSNRQVDEWRRLGLLGQPTRQRAGKTGQGLALYSPQQRELFRAVTRSRVQGVSNQRLTSIPIWAWMTFGEPWVDLLQLRAAMSTYIGGVSHRSHRVAAIAARVIVETLPIDLPKGRAKDRAALKSAVAEQLLDVNVDETILERLVKNVFDGAAFSGRLSRGLVLTPEMVVHMLSDRTRAAATFDTLPDEPLEVARIRHRISLAGYQVLALQAPPEEPDFESRIFGDTGLMHQVTSAPATLLLLLGQILRADPSAPAT